MNTTTFSTTTLLNETTNPVFALFEDKELDVISTRELLFQELNQASPEACEIIQGFFYTSRATNPLPSIAEMLPWIVGDLAGIEKDHLRDIASGWLGVYIYGILLDHKADSGKPLNAEEQLASIVLYTLALRKLQRAIGGTPYEQIFYDQMSIAVRGQLSDIRNKSNLTTNGRELYSLEKNSGLVSVAIAVAAILPESGKALIELTERLRLPIQFLDDIADWEEDARSNTHTVLLAEAVSYGKSVRGDSRPLSEIPSRDLILLLVESGSLEKVLRKIDEFFLSGDPVASFLEKCSPSSDFLKTLHRHLQRTIQETVEAKAHLPNATELEKRNIGVRMETSLKVLAQTT